jgi:hypothetical protein
MKKFFTIASLLALTLSACSREAVKSEQEGKGQVSISCVVETNVADTRADISCETPTADDFALTIEGVGHTFHADYATLAEFNADNYLHLGNYKATVVAGDIAEEGFNKPAFVGSEEFVVEARKDVNVEITASIANAIVKVETTERFENYFEGGYTLALTTEAGNEFDVTAQSDLLFIAPASFSVAGTAVKQSAQSGEEGVTVTLPQFNQSDVVAQTLYTVKFDVETAGSATLTITLNETLVESIDIDQELNDNAQ